MRGWRIVAVLSAVVVAALLGAAAAKLDSRIKLARSNAALCYDVPCAHFNARMQAIESVIAQRDYSRPVYLAIGDSITELADLPFLCGRKPINAGMGWATVETFEVHAKRLAELAQPDFILVELGANDALRGKAAQFSKRLAALLTSLAAWPVVVVPLPPSPGLVDAAQFNSMIAQLSVTQAAPLTAVETTADGVHLTAGGYVKWRRAITEAVESSLCS